MSAQDPQPALFPGGEGCKMDRNLVDRAALTQGLMEEGWQKRCRWVFFLIEGVIPFALFALGDLFDFKTMVEMFQMYPIRDQIWSGI